jgi:hypothetical protein
MALSLFPFGGRLEMGWGWDITKEPPVVRAALVFMFLE